MEVDFILSDMGIHNIQLWTELGLSTSKSYFDHPLDSNRKIYVFADAQHLYKNIT